MHRRATDNFTPYSPARSFFRGCARGRAIYASTRGIPRGEPENACSVLVSRLLALLDFFLSRLRFLLI